MTRIKKHVCYKKPHKYGYLICFSQKMREVKKGAETMLCVFDNQFTQPPLPSFQKVDNANTPCVVDLDMKLVGLVIVVRSFRQKASCK